MKHKSSAPGQFYFLLVEVYSPAMFHWVILFDFTAVLLLGALHISKSCVIRLKTEPIRCSSSHFAGHGGAGNERYNCYQGLIF